MKERERKVYKEHKDFWTEFAEEILWNQKLSVETYNKLGDMVIGLLALQREEMRAEAKAIYGS